MKLAIYAPFNATFPFILAPECMQPSIDCEHRYGRLRLVGTITLADCIVQAIGDDISPATGNIEYLVSSQTAQARLEALMERAH